MSVKSIYAKCRSSGRLYTVDINYLCGERFILRPAGGWLIPNTPIQYITQTAAQIKINFRLFPIVGV